MYKILVADDEREIVELIELFLSKENIQVIKAYDGQSAINLIEQEEPHLAILDIMMPHINGFEIIRRIRKQSRIPILLLSAREDFSDKILGLDIGADDYITKPFNPLELVARVMAHLRRVYTMNASLDGRLIIGELELDTKSCSLTKSGEIVSLTSTEYKIIEYFMLHAGQVFTVKQLFEHIWEENYYDGENAVRVHISNIRDKIEADPKKPAYFKTVRGLGYKMEKF